MTWTETEKREVMHFRHFINKTVTMIVARIHDYQAGGIGNASCVTDKSNLSSDYYACDKRPSLLVLLLLLMLLLFLMMPKLKLASAVPRRKGCLFKHKFNWVLSAGNKYIPKYCGLCTTLPRPDIPYSQDARLPSSSVTYAPGRWPSPVLREAIIFNWGGWLGGSTSYQESFVPFVCICNFAILFNYLFNYQFIYFII